MSSTTILGFIGLRPDALGWTAAALMVATFACREAKAMRALAVATNLAFIGYGFVASLMPVLVLHLVLLPINLWRLIECHVPGSCVQRLLGAGLEWSERARRCGLLALLGLATVLAGCGGGGTADEPPAAQATPTPLEMTGIYRQWEFKRYLGRFSKEVETLAVDHSSGGEVQATAQLGAYYAQPPHFDIAPNHEIYSSASGMTYWAAAESPAGFSGHERPIGATTRFSQQQAFVKLSDDATLEYVVNGAIVQLSDSNPLPADGNDCPISMEFEKHPVWGTNSIGQRIVIGEIERPVPDGIWLHCNLALQASIEFRFKAVAHEPGDVFSRGSTLATASAYVEMNGSRGNFEWAASDTFDGPSWMPEDFEGGTDLHGGQLAYQRLKRPYVIKVPLDKVPVGATIVVLSDVRTEAYDFRQRESSAHAFFRDPGQAGGGEIRATGLRAVPMTAPVALGPEVDPTPECGGPAEPARGTIAFASTAFEGLELPGLGVPVTLVRTGGTSGEVSVLLQTLEGTASASTDFEDATQRVRFRDGQKERTVRIRPRLDDQAELNETVLLRLAVPRGCAAVGAQSEAVLTIRDDDHPLPPPVTYRVGGTVSGLLGPGLILYDEHQVSNLPVAADGSFTMPHHYAPGAPYRIVVVSMPANPAQRCTIGTAEGTVLADVTQLQVVCEAPVQTSGLDTSFGALGKVVDGLPGGARAIARQSTGHILATNGTSLVRYHADGRLDTRFNGGTGRVDNLLTGLGAEVADLAVGPDDRIVVAGRILQPAKSPPFYQMAAARFNADGTRDTGFGSGGMVTLRLAGVSENATRVLVQPDGRVLLVGQASFERGPLRDIDSDIVVARLEAHGAVDTSFGMNGATLADAFKRDFAFAAALQPDGRIVVAGRTTPLNPQSAEDTVFTRLTADGAIEPGFGRNPAYSLLSDEAVDVALQPDGKLVLLVVGRGTHAEILVVRLNPDGSLDTGFANSGLARSDVGPHDDLPRAVAVQADGKIVVAAQVSNDGRVPPSFALLRYGSDGQPDAGFGTNGVLRVPWFGGLDSANDLLVQPDGRIVAAGAWRSGITAGIALIRLIP
jgi:uncharacterized delta-60 repeat protein